MNIIQKFISQETAGGFLLFLSALIALIWSNTPLHASYSTFSQLHFEVTIGHLTSHISVPFMVNEMLMTLFFFLIGLEVKRELIEGELNSVKKAMLPAIAALGGMLIPALIYAACNWSNNFALKGWAIPTATDIAFSLAVLSLLGKRVPLTLKIFLTALAIFDDLGAIAIIAFFYTERIVWSGILCAIVLEIVLIVCNIYEWISSPLYIICVITMWWLLWVSGIHPTLAGVLIALTVPLKTQKNQVYLLRQYEQSLHPYVVFFVLPLFALINAGISFQGFFNNLIHSVSLGIFLGLFVGKPIGVLSFCWVALKFRIAQLPRNVNWKHLTGISFLCGIGFTMSFFIGFLSFDESALYYQNYLRSGILLGSFLSGIVGYFYLSVILNPAKQGEESHETPSSLGQACKRRSSE